MSPRGTYWSVSQRRITAVCVATPWYSPHMYGRGIMLPNGIALRVEKGTNHLKYIQNSNNYRAVGLQLHALDAAGALLLGLRPKGVAKALTQAHRAALARVVLTLRLSQTVSAPQSGAGWCAARPPTSHIRICISRHPEFPHGHARPTGTLRSHIARGYK